MALVIPNHILVNSQNTAVARAAVVTPDHLYAFFDAHAQYLRTWEQQARKSALAGIVDVNLKSKSRMLAELVHEHGDSLIGRDPETAVAVNAADPTLVHTAYKHWRIQNLLTAASLADFCLDFIGHEVPARRLADTILDAMADGDLPNEIATTLGITPTEMLRFTRVCGLYIDGFEEAYQASLDMGFEVHTTRLLVDIEDAVAQATLESSSKDLSAFRASQMAYMDKALALRKTLVTAATKRSRFGLTSSQDSATSAAVVAPQINLTFTTTPAPAAPTIVLEAGR